jgi:hypothetical protein
MKYILQQTPEGSFYYVAKSGSTIMLTSAYFKQLKNAKKSLIRTINAHMVFFKKSGVQLSWKDIESRVTLNF